MIRYNSLRTVKGVQLLETLQLLFLQSIKSTALQMFNVEMFLCGNMYVAVCPKNKCTTPKKIYNSRELNSFADQKRQSFEEIFI
jgi:hypothetical protein